MKNTKTNAKPVSARAIRASRQAIRELTGRLPENMVGVYIEVNEKEYKLFKEKAKEHKLTFAELCRKTLATFNKEGGAK